jgi:hypothetical protein
LSTTSAGNESHSGKSVGGKLIAARLAASKMSPGCSTPRVMVRQLACGRAHACQQSLGARARVSARQPADCTKSTRSSDAATPRRPPAPRQRRVSADDACSRARTHIGRTRPRTGALGTPLGRPPRLLRCRGVPQERRRPRLPPQPLRLLAARHAPPWRGGARVWMGVQRYNVAV